MTDTAADEMPQWVQQAAKALEAAMQGEPADGVDIVAEMDPRRVPGAMLAWIDLMLHELGNPDPAQVQVRWIDVQTEAITGADDTPRHIVWAGRLMTARLNDDQDTFEALMQAVDSDTEWTENVSGVLNICTNMMRAAQTAEAEQQDFTNPN